MSQALSELLQRAIDEGVTSSADLAVVHRGERLLHLRLGRAAIVPEPRPLGPAPRWDLASVTKPLVGAAVAYRLIDQGRLGFDEEAREWVPAAPPGATVAHLLSHGAGYPAGEPYYAMVDAAGLAWGSPEARRLVLDAAARTPVLAPPGRAHCYSDTGFLVLCDLLERAGGARLDALWRDLVAEPAGLTGLTWGGGDVATEDCPVRGRVVVGQVHDLNCAAMGGISTHAGLFGDALAVAAAAQAALDAFHGRGPLAGPSVVRGWTERGPGSHHLGWDGRSVGVYTSTGAHFPDDTVGHLGFTGTSLWIAPRIELIVVLLTNRVHPTAADNRIRALRPAVHDEVWRTFTRAGRW